MSLFEAVCGLESQQMSSSSGAIDDTLASQLEQEVSIAQDNFGPALEPPDSAVDHWQIYAEGFDEHRWSNPQIHPIFNDAFSPTSGDSSDQTWFPVHAYAYEANQTGDGHTEHTWRQIQMEGNHGDLGDHAATSSARGNAGYAMNCHIQDLVSQDRIKAQSLEHQQQQQNHLNLSSAEPGLPHNQQSRPLLYNFDSTGLLLACHTAESRPAAPFPTPNNRVNGFSFVQPTSFPEQQPAFEPSPVSGFVRAPPPVYHVRPMVQVAKPVPRAVIMNQAGILGPYPGHQHSNQSSRSCSPMLPMYSPGHGLDQPYTSTYSGATAANHGNNKITDSLLANRALVEYYSAAHRSYSQVTPNFVIEPPDDHFASIPLIETGALKLSLPNLRMPPPKPQIPSKAYRIWMDGIKWKTTELDFWIYFMAHYGSVLSVKILKRNRRKDHRNGGGDGLKENIDPLDVSDEAFEKLDFGFVEVAEESIAKRIIRDLGGLGYRVRHATELPIDPKAVHLKNLPMSMDSKGLADFIRSQGLEGIDTVKVLRQPANRLSASAFIRASSELSAYKLIRGMHGKACPGSQYTIEARFAYHNNKKATVNEYQKYGPATLSKYVLTTNMGALSPLIGNNFTWVTMPCGYDTAYSQAQLKCVVWVPNSVVPGSEHPFLPILIFSDRLPLLGVPSPRHGAFAGLPFESSPGDVFHAPVLEFNVSKMTIPLVAYPTFEKLVAEVPEPDSDDDDTECSLTMPITAPSAAAPAPAQPGPL